MIEGTKTCASAGVDRHHSMSLSRHTGTLFTAPERSENARQAPPSAQSPLNPLAPQIPRHQRAARNMNGPHPRGLRTDPNQPSNPPQALSNTAPCPKPQPGPTPSNDERS